MIVDLSPPGKKWFRHAQSPHVMPCADFLVLQTGHNPVLFVNSANLFNVLSSDDVLYRIVFIMTLYTIPNAISTLVKKFNETAVYLTDCILWHA